MQITLDFQKASAGGGSEESFRHSVASEFNESFAHLQSSLSECSSHAELANTEDISQIVVFLHSSKHKCAIVPHILRRVAITSKVDVIILSEVRKRGSEHVRQAVIKVLRFLRKAR